MLNEVGMLKGHVVRQIINAIIEMLQSGIEQREIEHDTTG